MERRREIILCDANGSETGSRPNGSMRMCYQAKIVPLIARVSSEGTLETVGRFNLALGFTRTAIHFPCAGSGMASGQGSPGLI